MSPHERAGQDALWQWFGLSYASWLTLPRVLMHEMPDDWQRRMADLLREWDEAWDTELEGAPTVSLRRGGQFVQVPEWLTHYRHPDRAAIAALCSKTKGS